MRGVGQVRWHWGIRLPITVLRRTCIGTTPTTSFIGVMLFTRNGLAVFRRRRRQSKPTEKYAVDLGPPKNWLAGRPWILRANIGYQRAIPPFVRGTTPTMMTMRGMTLGSVPTPRLVCAPLGDAGDARLLTTG